MFFWINRKKDALRKTYMNKEFENAGIKNHCRIDAVTPVDLKQVANIDKYNTTQYGVKLEEIACMCSHLLSIEEGLKRHPTESFFFIMEDDLKVSSLTLDEIDNAIKHAPNEWEILQLHYINFDKKEVCKNIDLWNSNEYPYIQWNRKYYSTAFYAITKKGANKLLKSYKRFGKYDFTNVVGKIQADKLLYEKSKTYTLCKPLTITNIQFDSSIQTNYELKKYIQEFNDKIILKN